MSISREEANRILSGNLKKPEPDNKSTETPSVTETPKAEETTPSSTEPAAVEPSGVPSEDPKSEPAKKVDDPKAEPATEVKDDNNGGAKPQDPPKQEPQKKTPQEKRDHAFIREKTKRKEAQKRVKELEAELEKYKGLKPEHFKKDDGGQDVEAYFNYRQNEQNMKNEIARLQEEERLAEMQEQVDRDRYITDHSFRTEQEKQSYLANVRDNLPSLIEELKQSDPDGVILSYLGSLNQYPIVLDKMLSDPSIKNWVLRSSDKNSIQRRIEKVADDILDQYWKEPEKQPITPTAAAAPKPAIPVTGRQVTATTGRTSSGSMKDKAYWNEWLRTHR